jgi:nucleoside-diphosphate-sugar epimerase
MTRSESKRAMLHGLGAVPVIADALGPDGVAEAVRGAKPDVIVHEADPLDPPPTRRRRRPSTAPRGVYNVIDDDPAPVAEWLPALAQTLGAKMPMRVPRFIGRLFAGEAGVVMMTEIRGASNAKAKRELAWRPAHPSWRQGLAAA